MRLTKLFAIRIAQPILVLLALTATLTVQANPYEQQLSNGLRVIVKEDHRAPTVAHMVWYRAGITRQWHTGVAHCSTHDVRRPAGGRFIAVAAGRRDNAFTSRDYTAYFSEYPNRNWRK
jgi:zinc protease